MVNVLFISEHPEAVRQVIAAQAPNGFAVTVCGADDSETQKSSLARDADFVMLHVSQLTDDVLRAGGGRVKLVQFLGGFNDQVNLQLANELGITVATNGGANSYAIAEHTILLMLALHRRLPACMRFLHAGRWRTDLNVENENQGIAGKVVGILGLGKIGKQVARRLRGFDVNVLYHDTNAASPEEEKALGVTRAPFTEVLRRSDVVTVHVSLSPATRHMLGRRELALMKPSAFLVNTARGKLIDEEALCEALRERRLRGAGLDVFEREPLPADSPLLTLDNVVLTQHIGGIVADAWIIRARNAFANMERVRNGLEPEWMVDQQTRNARAGAADSIAPPVRS